MSKIPAMQPGMSDKILEIQNRKCSFIFNDSFRMVVVGLILANVIVTIAMIIDAVTMRGPIRVNGDVWSTNEVISAEILGLLLRHSMQHV